MKATLLPQHVPAFLKACRLAGVTAQVTGPDSGRPWMDQVEGEPDEAALTALRQGVMLKDGITLPARAQRIPAPEGLWERDPPVRVRQTIPTSWIELVIREGRNRQVRRMTAAVGNPTLRLIRAAIGPYRLQGLPQGTWKDDSPTAM